MLGWMLGSGAPNYAFFTALDVLLLIGGVGGYLLGYETRGKSLEAVAAELAGTTGQV